MNPLDITHLLPEAVKWSDGMLLAPQHFQQNDLYWGSRLRQLMAQLQPWYWGVLELEVDRGSLSEGKVWVKRLQAVMPDGLVVQQPVPGGEAVLNLDLAKHEGYLRGVPVRIHLAVPVRVEGAASRSAAMQRFDAVPGAVVADDNTGEGWVEVSRLRPRLALLPADQLSGNYVSFPLLEVMREPGGVVRLTPFHPPLLRAGASAFLGNHGLQRRFEGLIAVLREKARELAGRAGGEQAEPEPRQRPLVAAVTTALPQLEVLVEGGLSHPRELYLGLAVLGGQLATVLPDPIPLKPDPYLHDDCMPAFERLLGHLEQQVKGMQVGYRVALFRRVSGGVFECELEPGWTVERLLVELRPRSGGDPEKLRPWLEGARIGSKEIQPLLAQRRVTGATVADAPAGAGEGLSVQRDGRLVELVNGKVEYQGKEIHVIRRGSLLRIEGVAGGGEPGSIVLFRRRKEAGSGS